MGCGAAAGLSVSERDFGPHATPRDHSSYVYILRLRSGALYIDMTRDLERRWEEQQEHQDAPREGPDGARRSLLTGARQGPMLLSDAALGNRSVLVALDGYEEVGGMDRWETIYTGPPWQVDLHRGRLESEGIMVFVPDASTKVVDPFVTGLNPFSAELRVPSSSVQRASELLAGALDGEEWGDTNLDALALGSAYDAGDGSGEASAGSNSSHDDGAEDETTWTGEEVESLATRTRWAAVMGLTIPFALMYGAFYLVAARESGLRSPSHRLTLWAIGYSILVLSLLVLFVFTRP